MCNDNRVFGANYIEIKKYYYVTRYACLIRFVKKMMQIILPSTTNRMHRVFQDCFFFSFSLSL